MFSLCLCSNSIELKFVFVFQIVINLQSHASTVSLTEVEIWVREDPEETQQTPYLNGVGAAYLLPDDDGSRIYTFDTVSALL